MIWPLIIGIVSGWLAGQFSRGRGFGLFGDLLTGVLGAFLGGFLFKMIGISAYGIIGSIVVSTIGAVILLWVLGMFKGSRVREKTKRTSYLYIKAVYLSVGSFFSFPLSIGMRL